MNTNSNTSMISTLNAFFLARLEKAMHREYNSLKQDLFVDLPKQVVEIGPGTGANFPYYPPGTEVLAIEPNAAMHPYLQQKAATHKLNLTIKSIKGESIDLEDESCECVVGTLVLCTVEEPTKVISEVMRILKPGGRYIFLEHIHAKSGFLKRLQRVIAKPWSWLFEGCCLIRDTDIKIKMAGFEILSCFRHKTGSPLFYPIQTHIFGVAIK